MRGLDMTPKLRVVDFVSLSYNIYVGNRDVETTLEILLLS
jgi:hypothetical protein